MQHVSSTEQHQYCVDTLQQLMNKRNQQWAEIEADALWLQREQQLQRQQQLDNSSLLSGLGALEEEATGNMDLAMCSVSTALSDEDDNNSVFLEDPGYNATDTASGGPSADGAVGKPVRPVSKQKRCPRSSNHSRQHLLSSHTSWLSDSCSGEQSLQGDTPCLVYPVVPRYRLRTISGEIEMDITEV